MSSALNKARRLPRKPSTGPILTRTPSSFNSKRPSTFSKNSNSIFDGIRKTPKASTSLLTRSKPTTSVIPPPDLLPLPSPPKSKKKSAFPDKEPPLRIKPAIVYEDGKYLVINKRTGVAIQGTFGSTARISWDQTLEDLRARPGCDELAPVHRLDRNTTGCIVFAKSPGQAKKLTSQFQSRDVHKTYLAVVNGSIKPGFEGEIESRLRVDEDCVRVCQEEEGSPAKTKWKCLSTSPKHSLLQLEPSTGRKHQLRVHLASTLQAGIVGDFKYAMEANQKAGNEIPSDTMLLHASNVSFFTWDKVGKRSQIEARAKPPINFVKFCEEVGLILPSKKDTVIALEN